MNAATFPAAYRGGLDAFPLDPANTALLVVDMQFAGAHAERGWCRLYQAVGMEAEFSAYTRRLAEIIPRIRYLQDAFRAQDAAVVFLTIGSERADLSDLVPRYQRRIAYWRARGIKPPYARVGDPDHAILPELQPRSGELVVNKTTASAFASSPLDSQLRQRGIQRLVIVGIGTNYCVESTLRGAADYGYDCVLVEDACGAILPEIHERAVQSMAPFCKIATTEEVVGLFVLSDS